MLPAGHIAAVADLVGGEDVLLPAQGDAIAAVPGEDDVVGHVADAVAAVRPQRDGVEELRRVGDVGVEGAVGGARVVDADVWGDGVVEAGDAVRGEGVEPAGSNAGDFFVGEAGDAGG